MKEKTNSKTFKLLHSCIILAILFFILLATPIYTLTEKSSGYTTIDTTTGFNLKNEGESKYTEDLTYIEYVKKEIKEMEADLKEINDTEYAETTKLLLTVYKSDLSLYNSVVALIAFNSLFLILTFIMLILYLIGNFNEGDTVTKAMKITSVLLLFVIFIIGCTITGIANNTARAMDKLLSDSTTDISITQTLGPCLLSFSLIALIAIGIISISGLSFTKPKQYVLKPNEEIKEEDFTTNETAAKNIIKESEEILYEDTQVESNVQPDQPVDAVLEDSVEIISEKMPLDLNNEQDK